LQQWFLAIYLLSSHKKGLSSYQLARDLDITQKSAWFMIQRISYAMNHSAFTSYMEGIVEVDETFVGGKNKNRHADKKVKNSQGRSFKDKTPVLGMLNREGSLKCVVIPDTTGDNIQPILRQHISDGSIVMTDEWKAYNGLNNAYEHQIVDHGRKQYVNESGATTNRIENAWSNFKKSIIGIHHNNLSRKHLQQYTNAFTFRFNTRNYMTDDRFNLLLIDLKGKRLTYKNLITQ
jgi:transposase-like protein